jgi:phage tail sheath protein FI
MPQYLSPGVYVEEIPSAVQAIAGVSTSTAGFIGFAPETIVVPPGSAYVIEEVIKADGKAKEFDLKIFPVIEKPGSFSVTVSTKKPAAEAPDVWLENRFGTKVSTLVFTDPPPNDAEITVSYRSFARPVRNERIGKGDGTKTEFALAAHPVEVKEGTFRFTVGDQEVKATLSNDFRKRVSRVTFDKPPAKDAAIAGNYYALSPDLVVLREQIGVGNASARKFQLAMPSARIAAGMFAVRSGNYALAEPVGDVSIVDTVIEGRHHDLVTFKQPPALNQEVWADYIASPTFPPLREKARLVTSFSEYRRHFGDFSTDPQHSRLTHAVYGFFNNGGSRCYVGIVDPEEGAGIDEMLEQFAAIDEIAIVVAPGITNEAIRDKIVTHCKIATQDRFAILDSDESLPDDDLSLLTPSNPDRVLPPNSDYAAFYFPWIQVFDPAVKTMDPTGDGYVYVPPSGHVAGIYARTDNTRGVFKAPANEVVLGALDLRYKISKAQQDGLNPQGVNCIRELNGNIRVWGARTIGGDANGEWRYINVRRTMLYLRESIDEGTQWAVFEPNDINLWAKITRNVSAFLTIQWRAGMLFGATPQEAFYVKCDAETNPPELREIGQVVTEIGVAIVRPAEFVIFRISQWQPPAGS